MLKELGWVQASKLSERWGKGKRNFRLLYLRLLRLRGQPREVAGGVAIGVFVGMTPTVPLHTLLAVLIALILKKSKLAAALGVWIANPFFLPFIYFLDYKVGQLLTGTGASSLPISNFSVANLVHLGWSISFPLFFGGVITGIVCAIPSYFISKRLIFLYQARRCRRKGTT